MFSMLDLQANNLSEFIPDWTLYISGLAQHIQQKYIYQIKRSTTQNVFSDL